MRLTTGNVRPNIGRFSWAVLLCLICLPLPGRSLCGQEIKGRLLESGTRIPIPWGSVSLLDSTYSPLGGAITDDAGAFLIQTPGPGSYYILGEGLGYEPKVDGVLELESGGSVSIEFYLRPKPVQLEEIVVALDRHRVFKNLSNVGYYERQKQGFGTFLTPEEIERRDPRTAFDLFRQVPDLRIGAGGVDGTRLYLVRGGTVCNPRVYINGMQIFNDPITAGGGPGGAVDSEGQAGGTLRPSSGVVFEQLVNIEDVVAVEVHTRATSIPLLYGGTQEGCGAILVWTHIEVGGTP